MSQIHVQNDSDTSLLEIDVKRGDDNGIQEINLGDGEKIQFSSDKVEFVEDSGKMSWFTNKDFEYEDDEIKIKIKPDGEVEELHKADKVTITISADGTNISAKDESNNDVTDFESRTEVNLEGTNSKANIDGKVIETLQDGSKNLNYSGHVTTFKDNLSFDSKSLTQDESFGYDPSTKEFVQTYDGETMTFKSDGTATKQDRDGKESTLSNKDDGSGKILTYSDGTVSDINNDGSMEKTLCNGYHYVKSNDGSFKIYDQSGILVKSEIAPEGGETGSGGPDLLNIINVHTNTDNNHVIINIRGDTLVIKLTEGERLWDGGEDRKYTFNEENTVSVLTRNEADDGFDETVISATGSVNQSRGTDVVTVNIDGTITGDAFEPDYEVFEEDGMVITKSFMGLEFKNTADGKTQIGSDYTVNFLLTGSTLIMLNTGETITVSDIGECMVTSENDSATLEVTALGAKTLTDENNQVTTVQVNSDGDQVITYPDGTTATISAEGIKETTFDNGGSSKTLPYGCYVEFNANNDVIYFAVGHNEFKFDRINLFETQDEEDAFKLSEEDMVIYKSTDEVELRGYNTFDMTYNKTTEVLTVNTPNGVIEVEADGAVTETQGNGNVIEISNDGTITGINSAGTNLTGSIFTPVKFVKEEDDWIYMSLPGDLMVQSHKTNGMKSIESRKGKRMVDTTLNYEGFYKTSDRIDMINPNRVLSVIEHGVRTIYNPDQSITIEGENGNDISSTLAGDVRTTTDTDGNTIEFSPTTGLTITIENMKFKRAQDGTETLEIDGNVITQDDVETNQQATTAPPDSGSGGGSGPQP